MSAVFISYSHKDKAWMDRLLTHLGPLRVDPGFAPWSDQDIAAGDDWQSRIESAMRECRLAVMLISPDFLVSKFITGVEVPKLLKRREREGMRIYPILVKSCVYRGVDWLAPFQIRPEHARPLASFGSPTGQRAEKVLAVLAEEIMQIVRSLASEKRAPSVAPMLQTYLDAVATETGELRLVGLAQNIRISLRIDEAYVPLRVMTSLEEDLDQFGMLDGKRGGERAAEADTDVEELFVRAAQARKRGCVILGMPGSGKTTAARRICWRLAKNTACAKELGLPEGTLPVWLPLRRLDRAKLVGGLEAFLDLEVERLIGLDKARELGLLKHPHLLWMFDGLDEVMDEATRAAVSGRIQQLLWDRRNDHFLVTSRYSGYQREAQFGRDFLPCHVRPLIGAEVSSFVQRWYSAAASVLGSQAVSHYEEAQSLLSILNQPEYQIGNLRGLRTNPLLLTILCVVHHQDRNLPGRRVELYQRCVRVLLEHWRRDARAEQGRQPYAANDAENALAVLAWWLHQEAGRTSTGLNEAATQLRQTLSELPANSGLPLTGREFLEQMRDDSGVLVPAGPGQIGFLHLTFQEYLTARYAVEERRSAELVMHLGESWWREPILLALAQGTRPLCREFFQALVNTGDLSRHSELIDQCIEEAAYFIPEPFLQRLTAPGTSASMQIDILKRLKNRASPAVVEVCKQFAAAAGELGQLAREILAGQEIGMEPTVEAGQPRVMADPRTGLSFVWIKPGRFQMGSARGHDRENPVHTVELSNGFWLSRYAVTNQDYGRFLEASSGAKPPACWDNQRFNGKAQPVVGVSWNEAVAYCRWVGCRLPTEAEWEYACRAGSQDDYCFGNDREELKEFAWFGEEWGTGSTHPVGQKRPNAWGLYDMHGNVWEWCQDGPRKYSKEMVIDPIGPLDGSDRVLRGGSWSGPAGSCRSASRDRRDPLYWDGNLGFRVVLARSSVPGQEEA